MVSRKEAGRRGTSSVVEMFFVIGGIGLAFATAVVVAIVRVQHHRAEKAREAEQEQAGEIRRRAEEARRAFEHETQRQAEEARRVEEARVVAEREARRQSEEEARLAVEQEAQRQAEEARRRAEEEARLAAEKEAQCQAEATRRSEGARRQADEETRLAEKAQLQVEKSRRRVEEDGHLAAEQETQCQAEERWQAEEEMRAAAPEHASRTAPAEIAEALGEPLEASGSDVAVALPQAVSPEFLGAPALVPRTPRQYRPTARAPAPLRAPPLPSPERETRERAVPIEVRLVFEKAGFCRVSLLPRRAAGMPAEFAVEGSGSPPELQALQDEWYQDVMLPDIGRLLSEGIDWAGALPGGTAGRLSLSGRGIFVLARHGELNGFVTTPRLVLGEEHVILCVTDRLPDVRAAIALTESPEPTELNSDSGVPDGWVGLRGVRPRKPVAPSPGGDIIDALKPLPDVEIVLNGGIRIDRQTWLSGFPPTVELLGDTSTLGMVTIDGQEAMQSTEGGYIAPGWDSPGEHTVWCTSASLTYSIQSGAEAWEPWDAYVWSLGELTASGTQSRPAICGVLVRPPRVARSDSRPTVVAASNPILIGARPGEVVVCTPRGDVRAGLCVGFPWFEPIWAIPANALHCDKRTARVLLIGPPVAVDRGNQQSSGSDSGRAARRRSLTWESHAWCEAICAAGRKGLLTEPSRVEIADLWKGYKRYAKVLRRASR